MNRFCWQIYLYIDKVCKQRRRYTGAGAGWGGVVPIFKKTCFYPIFFLGQCEKLYKCSEIWLMTYYTSIPFWNKSSDECICNETLIFLHQINDAKTINIFSVQQ